MLFRSHLRTIRKEGFALGNSSCLKIQRFERNLSHPFVYLLIPLLGEGGACGTKVAGFSAAETKLLLNTAFAFFWSKLGDLDRVYDHGVRIVGFGRGGVGEGMVGLMGGSGVSFGNVVSAFPLGLEGDGFLVPFVNGRGDCVHRHDAAHERGWDSRREIAD